jgi:hypothetical protein
MKASILTKQQYKSLGPRPIDGYGPGAAIWAHLRYDDHCGNGHNSFAITGTIRVPKQRDCGACGCLHDEIARAFPELSELIQWHLVSSDGPMHYLANTIYLAGDKDCRGKRKGEATSSHTVIKFGNSPITRALSEEFHTFLLDRIGKEGSFIIQVISHGKDTKTFQPKYTFLGYGEEWYQCPFDTLHEAAEWKLALETLPVEFTTVATRFSEGKERELDAARRVAVWPGATDDELMSDNLEELLEARLPALLERFAQAMEGQGFVY